MSELKIKQIRSGIGAPERQKRVLRSLGLGKMNRVVSKPDNDAIRGMVRKIPHLVRIEDSASEQGS